MVHRPIFLKISLTIFLVFLGALAAFARPAWLTPLWQVLASGDVQAISDYVRTFGNKAWIFSFLLTALVNAIGFPPAILFSAANTLLFGLVPGILLSWAAETVGVAVSFLVLRIFFQDTAAALVKGHSKLEILQHMQGKRGFRSMLIARLIPYFPSIVLNAFGALSTMSFGDYVLASFIGKFPSTAIEAVIGHDAFTISQHPERLAVTVTLTLCLYAAFRWYGKKKSQS